MVDHMTRCRIKAQVSSSAVALALALILAMTSASPVIAADDTIDNEARTLVRAAIDNWRGVSSYSEFSMTIHRPAWQRSMSMKAWTEGDESTLVRVTLPKKDAGNGTLLVDEQMWSYTPRINRVIKIPSSMMHQSRMGSDFSNRDISRADDILDMYEHRLLDSKQDGAHTLYVIESTPLENAAVVWGREVLTVRDDFVMLQHDFYDQDDQLFKSMTTTAIRIMDERPVATRQRMQKIGHPDEWTEIAVDHVDFDVPMPDYMFTLPNLRSPRDSG